MKTLARITMEELRQVVEEAIERKLMEMLSDPDRWRPLRAKVTGNSCNRWWPVVKGNHRFGVVVQLGRTVRARR